MQRIAIVGGMGVGKSVLSQRLGALLDLPVYHFDALFWQPGRIPTPEDEWQVKLREVLERAGWILDGFPLSVSRAQLDAADTILFLDLPRRVSIASVIRRRVQHLWRQPVGTATGCPPMFNARLFRWIWTYPEDHRPDLLQALAEQPRSKRVLTFRSRREVRRFLVSVERALAADSETLSAFVR